MIFSKRMYVALLTVLMIFTFQISLGAVTSDAKPIKIRIGHVNPPGSLDVDVIKLFTIIAEQKLQDKVEFEVFGGGTLGGYKEILEMIKADSLECLYESVGVLEPWTPLAGIEAVPYLYDDLQSFRDLWGSELGKEFLDKIAETSGFLLKGPHWRGFRIMTVRKEVKTPDDLKGLKLRVPNMPTYIAAWKALGASCAPMAFTEVFSALQQGVIDGQENPLSVSYASGFGEVCKYIVLTNHMAETMGFMFDSKYFANLPADVQEGLTQAAEETGRWHENSVLISDSDYIEKFKQQGCKIIEPDREAFKEKAKATELDPQLKEWADKFRK